jgi:Na+/proline symporter
MYLTGIVSIFLVYMSWTICSERFVSIHSDAAAKLSLFWIYAYSPAYALCFNALTYSKFPVSRQE